MDFTDNPELQAIFQEEVGERSADLANATRAMSERVLPPDDVSTARRNAHTIKGNAYVMGFQRMGDVAKVVEDALKEVVSESRTQSGQLGMLIADIADLFPTAVEAGPDGDVTELEQACDRLMVFLNGDDPGSSDRSDGDREIPSSASDASSDGDATVVELADKLADRDQIDSQSMGGSDLGGLVSSIVTSFSSHATRVPTTALYQMINRAVEVRLDMEVVLAALQAVVANPDDRRVWEDAIAKLEESVLRLQTDALDLATIPISEITGTLDQLVRYVARRTGKNVKFELIGDDIRVDRQVVDVLRDPLRQLVVNAVDHGMESPQERAMSGKPPTATLKVEFSIDNHVLHVVVSDDGRGIDWMKVGSAAAGRGLSAPDVANEDLTRLLFLPQFSTVDPPQEISGDGAGLAAANEAARMLNGDIRIASDERGTVVSLVVPRSLILQDLWIVEAEDQQWGIPEAAVITTLPATQVQDGQMMFRGVPLVLKSLAAIVGATSTAEPDQVVVVGSPEGQVGLLVSSVVGRRQVAVKSFGPILEGAPHLAAAAHLGGDEVVVVIDPRQIVGDVQVPEVADAYRPKVLVVDDSLGVRQLISATLGVNGFDTTVASDAEEALKILVESHVDALVVDFQMPGRDGIELVRQVRSVRRSLPIVMVSGVAAAVDQRRAYAEGVDAYLDKADFRRGALATTLWALCGAVTKEMRQ